AELSARTARFVTPLRPGEVRDFYLAFALSEDQARIPSSAYFYEEAYPSVLSHARSLSEGSCEVVTSNEQFNEWLSRSTADLRMMLSRTPFALYPYAGIPWYC